MDDPATIEIDTASGTLRTHSIEPKMTRQDEVSRLLWWLFVVAFFVIAPATILYAVALIVQLLSHLFPNSESGSKVVAEFYSDLPLILLTFYSGTLGGVVSYVYGRTQLSLASDSLVTKIAKLLFAGLIGVAVFFLLRSAALVKLFYPTLPAEQITAVSLNYHSVIVASFVAGLLGPAVVRSIQNRAEQFEKYKNTKKKH